MKFLSSECKTDQHSRCKVWAANGECEKNPLWMIPNCCVSCEYHQMPKGILIECMGLYKLITRPKSAAINQKLKIASLAKLLY